MSRRLLPQKCIFRLLKNWFFRFLFDNWKLSRCMTCFENSFLFLIEFSFYAKGRNSRQSLQTWVFLFRQCGKLTWTQWYEKVVVCLKEISWKNQGLKSKWTIPFSFPKFQIFPAAYVFANQNAIFLYFGWSSR